MARTWLAVDKNGAEKIFNVKPFRGNTQKDRNHIWGTTYVGENYELLDIDNLYEVIYIEEDGAFAFKCINKADNYEPYINVADTVVVGNKFDN